jgi:hypothetical protein
MNHPTNALQRPKRLRNNPRHPRFAAAPFKERPLFRGPVILILPFKPSSLFW